MVWVGMNLKDHLVPIPLSWAGHLPLDQVAQSPIQPGIEKFQEGVICTFSGQPIPVPHKPS